MTRDILRLGFLASHGGSAMQAIVDACREGRLAADPRVVISNNRGSVALQRGAEAGLANYLLNGKTHPAPRSSTSPSSKPCGHTTLLSSCCPAT